MLKIQNLNLEISSKKILDNINLEVNSGEIFNILGHNGSGKTSLLKSIIGINKAEGKIQLVKTSYGQDDMSTKGFNPLNIQELEINERANAGISYIMQEIPEYTGIPVETYLKGILKEKFDLEKVSKLFEDFGIDYETYKTRFFDSHLSGGERKKIEIITNFLMDKDLYLLDEIEASLDATSRDVLIKLIKKLNQNGKTFIIVSHSKDILELAENGILLCAGKIDTIGENKKLLNKYFNSCEGCKGGKCKI